MRLGSKLGRMQRNTLAVSVPLEKAPPVSPAIERRMVENDWLWCLAQIGKDDLSKKRKAVASLGPVVMGRVYFPDLMPKSTPVFHEEIVEMFRSLPRVGIAAPVGSAKTTLLTKLGSVWSLLFEEGTQEVLIVSASMDLVATWIDDMGRRIKTNEELLEDFGEELIGVHWGSEELEFVLKGPGGKPMHRFLRGLGRGGALRGRRPSRIVVDDPEDEEMIRSEKQRQDFSTWFWGALVNRLDEPWKKLTYIGTCLSYDAFLVSIINHPPAGWVTRAYAMLGPDGKSLWEDKYPTEFLRQRREEIGEERFQAEFMNNPVTNWHQKLFDTSRIERVPYALKPEDLLSMCIDPAFRRGGDAWAITVVGVDEKANWHVIAAVKDRTGTEGWLEAMQKMRERFPGLRVVGIESGGGQAALEYTVEDFMRRMGFTLPLEWIKHSPWGGRKAARIAQLTNVLNTGRCTLDPSLIELWREIETYRGGIDEQEDHLLDSLAMHLEVLTPKTPRERAVETPEQLRHRRFVELRKRIDKSKAAARPGILVGATSRFDRYLS